MEQKVINYVINTTENVVISKPEDLVIFYSSPFKILMFIIVILIILLVLLRYFQLRQEQKL